MFTLQLFFSPMLASLKTECVQQKSIGSRLRYRDPGLQILGNDSFQILGSGHKAPGSGLHLLNLGRHLLFSSSWVLFLGISFLASAPRLQLFSSSSLAIDSRLQLLVPAIWFHFLGSNSSASAIRLQILGFRSWTQSPGQQLLGSRLRA